ncbi:MAG: DJ-1 family glyoxalase III [Nitrospinaceae bacterium]
MTKKVLVPLAPGFEEIETITVVDILRRSGAKVTLAGTQEGLIEGSRGVRIQPDELLDGLDSADFDLIVLPGGQPGTTNLQNNPKVLALLRAMRQEDKLIAAICAAPLVLQAAGLLDEVRTTSHPSVRGQLNGVSYSEERVVADGKIITSRGPGTAMEFALLLVEFLFGKERVQKVNSGVMALI